MKEYSTTTKKEINRGQTDVERTFVVRSMVNGVAFWTLFGSPTVSTAKIIEAGATAVNVENYYGKNKFHPSALTHLAHALSEHLAVRNQTPTLNKGGETI